MKKDKTISKSKVTKIKSKVNKPSKRRLGMGLSSLLSTCVEVGLRPGVKSKVGVRSGLRTLIALPYTAGSQGGLEKGEDNDQS